jgi:hypothetical protein
MNMVDVLLMAGMDRDRFWMAYNELFAIAEARHVTNE